MLADLISVGTELTTGAVVNSNAAWLSQQMLAAGILVRRQVTVGDDLADLRDELLRSAGLTPVVLVTGGLGPTRDDLTLEALSLAMGQPLESDATMAGRIRAFFDRLGRAMPDANLQQARVPRGARAIPNDWGTAPGIRAELGQSVVYALPGVPREMMQMFAHHVLPELRQGAGDVGLAVRVLRTFGVGESALGERIADLMEPGRNPLVGTQASEGVISIRILGRGAGDDSARRLVEQDVGETRRRLGEWVFGEEDDTLASVIGRELAARRATLATAESCTGGLLAKMLTDVPGSSRYFLRGYVTYSNESKSELLGVPADLIESRGAVSEPVARAMAVGCRQRAGSDYVLSVTGIAGPAGETPDKSVGLVYVALADEAGCAVHRVLFGEHLDREAIRDRASKTALNLLRLHLSGPRS